MQKIFLEIDPGIICTLSAINVQDCPLLEPLFANRFWLMDRF